MSKIDRLRLCPIISHFCNERPCLMPRLRNRPLAQEGRANRSLGAGDSRLIWLRSG